MAAEVSLRYLYEIKFEPFSSQRGKTRLTRAPVYDNFAPP